jgi:hypothetical protein
MLKFCLIYYCTELFYFPRHQKGTAIRKTTVRMRLLKVARCKERLGCGFFPSRSPPGGYSARVKGRSMTENPRTLDT